MELLNRPGKTPFIGIVCADDNAAAVHWELIKNSVYDLKIDVEKDSVRLGVYFKGVEVLNYNRVAFNSHFSLGNFLGLQRPKGIINFGHIIWSIADQRYRLSNAKPFIIPIESVKISGIINSP